MSTAYGIVLLVLWVAVVVGVPLAVLARLMVGNVALEEYRKRKRR